MTTTVGELAALLVQLDNDTIVVLDSGYNVTVEVWAVGKTKHAVIRKGAKYGL